MRHLLQFLASVPSIESLRLEFEYAGIFKNETPWDGNSTPLQLPRLTQLSVAIRTRTQPILLEVLAENLDLLLSGMDPESLDLKFFDRRYLASELPCRDAFETMRSLRYLSVEAPGLHCPISWDICPIPDRWGLDKLRVLRLKNCHFWDFKQDRSIGFHMEDWSRSETLERIEFVGCPDIEKRRTEIEQFFPKEKLHWLSS